MPSCLAAGQAVGANLAGREIPIAGIAGDQQAALFGQACFEPGMAKNTYGTGCFLLMNTGDEPLASRRTGCSRRSRGTSDERRYALEGTVFVGGAVVQWLRDGLGLIEAPPTSRRWPRACPTRGGVYLVPAFTGLGSPHWDPYARGAILGLVARHHARAHRARRARGDRVPERRGPRRDAGGRRVSRYASCASTAAQRATTC